MQSNGLYIRVIDERLFKTTKEVTALTRDIDYIVDKFSDDIYRAALAVTGSVWDGGSFHSGGTGFSNQRSFIRNSQTDV